VWIEKGELITRVCADLEHKREIDLFWTKEMLLEALAELLGVAQSWPCNPRVDEQPEQGGGGLPLDAPIA
jgi:hypothetical protein